MTPDPDIGESPRQSDSGNDVTATDLGIPSHSATGNGHPALIENDARSSYGGSQSSLSGASSITSLGIIPFGFESRTGFDAAQNLVLTRSENFQLKPPPIDDDIWKRPPPNFKAQAHASKPPKRNSRDAMCPWKYGTIPGKREFIKRPTITVLPHILNPKSPEGERFLTRFDIPDSYEAKLKMAQELTNKTEPYENPKAHDHRGLPPLKPLGLDEFVTQYEKDPYNLNFKSQRLNILWDLSRKNPTERDIRGRQMCPPLHQPPKWESRLIMSKDKWPNKDYTYTRYRRRNRSPHEALMDRICDSLDSRWQKEKLDKAIRTQEAQTMQKQQA